MGFCEWEFIGQDLQNNFVFEETHQTDSLQVLLI